MKGDLINEMTNYVFVLRFNFMKRPHEIYGVPKTPEICIYRPEYSGLRFSRNASTAFV